MNDRQLFNKILLDPSNFVVNVFFIPLLRYRKAINVKIRALRHITCPARVHTQVNGAGLSPVIAVRSSRTQTDVERWRRVSARRDTAICWTRSFIIGTWTHFSSLSLLPPYSVLAEMQRCRQSLNVFINLSIKLKGKCRLR